jgi:hypothetical protein
MGVVATSAKSRAKPAPKSTGTKTAAKKTPARKAPAKAATKKEAPAKKAAARKKMPPPRPLMLDGEPASNRHFLLDRDMMKKATARCAAQGIIISDVLRHGVDVYAEGAPPEGKEKTALMFLPDRAMKALAKEYETNSERATHYMAALHRAGWPTRVIADSLVESGVAFRMSRQAVSLRVLKAPDELFDDLPKVPDLGPRRPIVSARKGQTGEYKPLPPKRPRDMAHDVGFRVKNSVYADAARRAKHEGAMMSGVLDLVLEAYLAGEYDKALVG